jgi:hypothetical protein
MISNDLHGSLLAAHPFLKKVNRLLTNFQRSPRLQVPTLVMVRLRSAVEIISKKMLKNLVDPNKSIIFTSERNKKQQLKKRTDMTSLEIILAAILTTVVIFAVAIFVGNIIYNAMCKIYNKVK